MTLEQAADAAPADHARTVRRGHLWIAGDRVSLNGLTYQLTAEASAFAAASAPAIEQLRDAGAAAELLHLPDHGVHGNGHGLIYEKNSDEALQPVLRWLERHAGPAGNRNEGE